MHCSYRSNYQEKRVGIQFPVLPLHMFVHVPCYNLDFQCHMSYTIVLLILVELITITVYKKKIIITCCYLILNGWFMVFSTTSGHERGSNSQRRDDRHLL
jgi:hypothetical protein